MNQHSSTSPLFRGIEHIGLSVPDLEAATQFFCDVLGCRLVHSRGPTAAADPTRSKEALKFLRDNLGVHEGTTVTGIAMLRSGHGANIELFEFKSSARREEMPNNADIGGHHLAFYSEDIGRAVEHLSASGARILGEVKTVTTGPEEGMSWVYFVAPWGLHMELVSYPQGKGYEKSDPPVRLWTPTRPAD
ncbi:VOC family protein [Bradyrhizobium sp. Gha]|uniref:VOC family protein n=1 Tax=Bradyrhizobium sp. Gha TaxID=1855318 RepID=UPI0008DEC278|nr:VOC family protein [Bradyrhizobium sp. Gha]SFI95159.1 Catechol 2,3-dioxygenase [Bradyrhizobium sp. Gha]